ncbi:MAG TPA: lipid-A-disaccharide synthase [Roseiarcus sp.]|nr:lipid-A-disaccharide synthase [Roseiarcus sp.]
MRRLKIALIAGEPSGDALGAKLIQALRELTDDGVTFVGVGGPRMEAAGLESAFPLSEVAVMGILPVLARLPRIFAHIAWAADHVIRSAPDGLILIDSPDFTHRVARRARAHLPKLPVIDYVSPTIWAWRPGRARKMTAYVDKVMALLPFEPAAHERLGGPKCVYVGHPLIERLVELRPDAEERARRESKPPVVLALPGSRRSEVARLMGDFGAALGALSHSMGPFDIVLPTLPHLHAEVTARAANWPAAPRLLISEADKFAAYRTARAALVASGTATLEVALAGVPLIGAYKVSRLEEPVKHFISVSSILLPNLILEQQVIPEFLQRDCMPGPLALAMAGILTQGPEREAQLAALARLDAKMRLPGDEAPSRAAAREALATIAERAAGD